MKPHEDARADIIFFIGIVLVVMAMLYFLPMVAR